MQEVANNARGGMHARAKRTVVWQHHGYGSEEGLEVVGQFGAAKVARVDGGKNVAVFQQFDLSTLEHKVGGLVGVSISVLHHPMPQSFSPYDL